jgi:hypothetical protein
VIGQSPVTYCEDWYYLLLRNYAPVPEAVEALKNPNAFPMPPIVPE